MNFIDLTGQRFGRLTVIKRSGYNNHRQITWLCRCDCGTEKIILGQTLRVGTSNSCGCLQREIIGNQKRIDFGLASMRQAISNYKAGARHRKRVYKLTDEQFKEITQKDCHYCGAKPNKTSKRKYKGNGYFPHNGLDRKDNSKGYTISNVVPCCYICNQAKHTLTIQEFEDWVRRVYNNMLKKEKII